MRKSEVLLTIALLGSASVSFWLWNELQAERARIAELNALVEARPAPVAAHEPTAAQPPLLPTQAPLAVLRSASTEAAPSQSPVVVQGAEQDWQAYQRRLLLDPKYREAWRQQQRLNYSRRRENLMSLLGFSAEQADAVIELSIDRSLVEIERPPTDKSGEHMKARIAAEEQEAQARLGALLGEEKRAQLQDYMESRGTRMQVDRFRTQMTGADALREDQVEPLIAALHVEQAQMNKEFMEYRDSLNWEGDPRGSSNRFGEYQLERLKAAPGRMHSAAATILSNSQVDRLDALMNRELERREAEVRMSRVQAKLD